MKMHFHKERFRKIWSEFLRILHSCRKSRCNSQNCEMNCSLLYTYIFYMNQNQPKIFCQFSSLNREIPKLEGKGHEPSRAEKGSARLGLITTSQFTSSSRSNWTSIWTGNSNCTWTDKQSSHFSTAKEIRVKTSFFFSCTNYNKQILKW